jgi:hypothetical protein
MSRPSDSGLVSSLSASVVGYSPTDRLVPVPKCCRRQWSVDFLRAHLYVPFVLFATWRALDGALNGNFKQHKRWVLGLFVGALLINGANNIFLLPGITHDVFFGR